MINKNKIVIISPLIIIGSMYPVFHFLSEALGKTRVVSWSGSILADLGSSISLADN